MVCLLEDQIELNLCRDEESNTVMLLFACMIVQFLWLQPMQEKCHSP